MTVLVHDGAPPPRRSIRAAVWAPAILGWLAMAVAMTLNGILRETALVPSLGARTAGAISAATGIALLQVIAWLALRQKHASTGQLIGIAGAWLVLTLAFEFGFGHYVDQKSWTELIANYDLLHGRLWPLVLASLVASPFLWGRERSEA
jgi:hypothetical protein